MIGLIDSGMGGVMMMLSLMKQYPHKSFTLFYDNAYFPYGEKTENDLIKRTIKILDKLKDCEKVILACNTLSTLELPYDERIVNIIKPTINLLQNYDCIAILCSTMTKKKGIYQRYLKGKNVDVIDGQILINAIERKEKIEEVFYQFDLSKYHVIVLGCTHFICIKNLFKIHYRAIIVSQDEIRGLI